MAHGRPHGRSLAKPAFASHVLLDLRRRWRKGDVMPCCGESPGIRSPHSKECHRLLRSEPCLGDSNVAVLLAWLIPFMQRVTQRTHDRHTPIMTGLARLQVFILKQSESRDASKCNMLKIPSWLGTGSYILCVLLFHDRHGHGRFLCCMVASPFLTVSGRP